MALNASQKKKRDFRKSKKWESFRHKKYVEQKGLCYITHKKLLKYANLHHLDLDEKNYEDISNPSHFVFLNKSIHKVVHVLWRYYEKDESVIDRLTEVLKRMKEINYKNENYLSEENT